MQPTILQERPPFVSIETRAEEDRAASIEAGFYKSKDYDYALITPAGSKDRVEQRVDEWFTKLKHQVTQDRFPAAWLAAYESAYKLWKSGQEIPLEGTSVRNWPILSPAQSKALIELNVRTVEDLAAANEEVISRLGMGGRALREKAKEWMDSKGGAAGKQAEQIVAMRIALENSEAARKEMQSKMTEMQAQLQALTQPAKK